MALGLHATFLNVLGLVFTLTGAFMSDWLGIAGWVGTMFGVIALLWSFVVTLFANRKVARASELSFVIKANLAMIVVAVLVVVWPGVMTSAGKTTLAIGAAITAAFTAAQALARRSIS